MLSDCHIHLILQLTNIYETSDPHFDYGVCTLLADNHGYSAGIIQFTTGTGSAQQVIQEYDKVVNPNEFTPMWETLEKLSRVSKQSGKATGDVVGLERYCEAWKAASKNSEFQAAQRLLLFRNYFLPAIRFAKARKLRHPVSFGQIYDSCVQMGVQGTESLLKSIRTQEDAAFVKEYLKSRRNKLESMGDVFAKTVTRVNSYENVLNQNKDWRDQINALNNDGNPIVLKCDSNFSVPTEVKSALQQKIPNSPNIPTSSSSIIHDVFWILLLILWT